MVQCDQRNDEEEQENECLSIGQIKQASSYSSSLKTNKSDRKKRRLIAQEEKRFLFPFACQLFSFHRDIVNNVFFVRNCLNRWSPLLSKLIQMTSSNLIIGKCIQN